MMKLLTLLPLLPVALGHMELSWPYAIRSKYNPKNNYTDIDYSMTSPLLADGSNFPCKGYQNDRPIDVVAEYSPGGTYNITLAGTATHGGGSCQISLSYDNGATFRVIKSMMGGCPLKPTWDFTMPTYVPQGEALLAWTWQNKLGNREYYMNCAEVRISGSAKRHRRDGFNSFGDLPLIWKANVPDVNSCTTTEGEIPVYPEPGPQTEYADGITASSPATAGTCNAATPFGATYKNLGDSVLGADQPGSAASQPPGASPTNTATTASTTSSTSSTTLSISATTSTSLSSTTSSSTRAAVSTTTTPARAVTTTTPSSRSSITTTRVASSTSSSSFPPAVNVTAPFATVTSPPSQATNVVTVSEVFDGTVYTTITITVATVTTLVPRSLSARNPPPQVPIMSKAIDAVHNAKQHAGGVAVSTVPVTADCPPPAATATVPHDRPLYAAEALSAYLPCVPGSFLCASATTFYTCDYDTTLSATGWRYAHSRQVAAGTECLPNTSPYSAQMSSYGQQGNTPRGTYRDDRIIRSRADAECNAEGALYCTASGTMFEVCDQGVWVEMGQVAPGTLCQNGAIVPL